MRKFWGVGDIFSVWIGQYYERICKTVILGMVPMRVVTHSFPFCGSRMTLAMVTNFLIFLTLSPVVAHLRQLISHPEMPI